MRILVSAVRMPFSLAVVRALGAAGHEIVATDALHYAPGMHSHYVREHAVTVAPRDDPARYIEQILGIYDEHAIELHVPTFEETFYLAAHLDELQARVPVFAAPLEPLHRLHDKATFVALCEQLGIRVPRTAVASSPDELRETTAKEPHYVARAAYSRGALQLLTNTGPRAGNVDLADCDPTADNPWLVQEYVDGNDLCSYSLVRDGRVAAHLSYELPITLDHAEGVQFETADIPETLAVAEKVSAELGFTGHLSFDYKIDGDGLCLIECNPRATNGALMMDPEVLAGAVIDGGAGGPVVTPAGVKAQVDLGVIVEILTRQIPLGHGLHELLRVRDLYAQRGDLVPELYQYLQLVHDGRIAHKRQVGLMDALQYDTTWDGTPIP